MDFQNLLSGLNDPQRQAVTSEQQQLLILAGAGSGKTRALTHRIAYLVETGLTSPNSILAVTFTNKAAKEMRSRIEELLEVPIRGMWVGTFHGLAHRLLKMHWQEAGLIENFQVMDSDDQLRLVKRIMNELGLNEESLQPKTAQWFINEQKDEGRRAKHLMPSNDVFDQALQKIYKNYEQACDRSGLVDFGELLLRAHELWLNNNNLLKHYQARFKHVLVDEFQDINTIQYAWLQVLCGAETNLTVVGDDDQSIYGWRGAKVENIQQFQTDFPNSEVIKLEQNYRSTSTILKAANAVIEHNNSRLGKNLWTDGEDGDPIQVYAAFNEQDEANYIADEINKYLEGGDNASEMAVLYRSNAQSRVLEESLIRQQIPYRIYGGLRFYDRMEIKNALAYLRLIANRQDDTAMERIINTPTRGIGGKTIETMRLLAREQGCTFWEAANMVIANKVLSSRALNAVANFMLLIDELEQATVEMDLAEMTQHVIQASGLIEHHEKEKGEKAQARLENLQELVSAARSFVMDEDSEFMNELDAFLDQASLDAGDRQADEFEDSVNLMTLHSAKGLEFNTVWLAGMEEGLFPHKMSIEDPNGLEEERRLAYVGITRAMNNLTLTYAESRRLFGNETFNNPSRFIKEIPSDFVSEIRLKSTVSKPYTSSYDSASNSDWNTGFGIDLGQRVKHPMFGEGTILSAEGYGSNASVRIAFDDAGEKVLMLQYAKLEPL